MFAIGAYIQFKYRNMVGKIIGHSAFILNTDHLREILDRYNVEPENLFDIKVNGKSVQPEAISKRLNA